MHIKKFYGVEQAKEATDFVVMIDVFRAATTAACALSQGAQEIIPVTTKEDAFAFKALHPNTRMMGEDHGIPIPGFDYGNSPFLISSVDLTGITIVHRSTQGTQGLVRATRATTLVFGGFVTAGAICSLIKHVTPETVSFLVLAGVGTEDDLFADYMIDFLKGKQSDMNGIVKQLRKRYRSSWFFDPEKPEFPEDDFSFCLDTDKYDFVVEAERTPYLHLKKRRVL